MYCILGNISTSLQNTETIQLQQFYTNRYLGRQNAIFACLSIVTMVTNIPYYHRGHPIEID
jgi:hypothetical protein